MIVINFKNYKQGKEALKLAKRIEKYLPDSIVAVPPSYLGFISHRTKLKVFSQHVDESSPRSTGFVTIKTAKTAGAKGSLLNHSENPVSLEKIKKVTKEKIKLIVCASSLKEVKEVKKLKPWAIAFEDPKLISTGKSITKHNPKAIKNFVKILEKTKIIPICGAGISDEKDYKEALKLGCKGVLIASAIAKPKNPEKLLKKLSKIK